MAEEEVVGQESAPATPVLAPEAGARLKRLLAAGTSLYKAPFRNDYGYVVDVDDKVVASSVDAGEIIALALNTYWEEHGG